MVEYGDEVTIVFCNDQVVKVFANPNNADDYINDRISKDDFMMVRNYYYSMEDWKVN